MMGVAHVAGTPSGADKQSAPTRGLVILGFVATTLFTSAISVGGSYWLWDRQADRAEAISLTSEFRKATQAFDPLFRAHLMNLNSGKDASASREALIRNIQQQHRLLEESMAYIPEPDRAAAKDYAEILVNITSEVEKANDPLSAGHLVQEVSYALEVRRRVIDSQRRELGLPSG